MSLPLGSAPEGKVPCCEWCRAEGIPLKPNPVYDRLCESCAAEIETFNASREELIAGIRGVVGPWVEKWAADLTFVLEPNELVGQVLMAGVYESAAVKALARAGIHVEQRGGMWLIKDGAA